MFLGQYNHVIDEKSRLTIPSKLRTQLSEKVYVSKGFDGCLEIRSDEEFKKYSSKLAGLTGTNSKVRALTRQIMSYSDDPTFDNAGRIKIASNLLQQANIVKEVIIIGNNDHLELWNPLQWNQYLENMAPEFEEIADLLSEGM